MCALVSRLCALNALIVPIVLAIVLRNPGFHLKSPERTSFA